VGRLCNEGMMEEAEEVVATMEMLRFP